MSDSVRPQRRQPTRLPRPWDSPSKSTGVGCHFLLQCMKVKSESEVAQLCPTPSNPMDCSPPGSSIHGICPARVLEWGAIAFSVQISSEGLLCARYCARINTLLSTHSCLSSYFIISISSSSSQILHAYYVLEVLFETKKVLQQMPNFTHTNTSPSKEITICGKFQGRVARLIFRSLLVLHHWPNLKTV